MYVSCQPRIKKKQLIMRQQLWHNIVYYWIGALTNNPRTLTHYVGVFRGVLGAGEALCFGLDSIQIPFLAEAGGVLLFYTIGISVFYYLGLCHMAETNYNKDEQGAVVPNHVLFERGAATDADLSHASAGTLDSGRIEVKVV